MSNITERLTRKLGPLPAWLWLALFAVGVWYYRSRLSGGAVSGTGTGSVTPGPTTPQDPLTLSPGDSVYDPNTGNLISTPGAGPGEYANPGQYGYLPATPPTTTTHRPGNGKKHHRPALTEKGAKYAPFGHRKPKPKPGYRIKGLGKGFWEYLPTKKRPRSKAHTRDQGRGRPKPHRRGSGGRHSRGTHSGPVVGRDIHPTAAPRPKRRTGPRFTGTTRQILRQRPATGMRPSHRSEPHPAPRPSAPPKRHHRTRRGK